MTGYHVYVCHGDDETCAGVAQFVSMNEDGDCPGAMNDTVCFQPSTYEDYFNVENCTTDRLQQLRTMFKDAAFLAMETTAATFDCADVNDSLVRTYGILADDTCYDPSTIRASYDDQGFAKLVIVHGLTCRKDDSFTVLLPPEFVADPYCVIYQERSYNLVSSAQLPSSATAAAHPDTASDPEAAMVYTLYEDRDCIGKTSSMHFRAHASCSTSFGESGTNCTRTFVG